MKKWILAVAIIGVSAFAVAASLSDGLVAYWPFDGNANDISGNDNNGSIHGATLTTDRHGDVESAMYFGAGNYIEVANSSSLNSIGSAITIAAWVKISNWHTTGQRWAALLSKGNYQYCFNLTPDDTSYGTEIGNGVKADFTGASLLGKWVHVAVSYGSDKVCRSYINGHLYKSKSCPSGSFPLSNASLIIGKHPPQALEYFIGVMDDLFIYNRTLSASEIRALQYNRPSVEFSVVTYNANANDIEGNMPEQTFDIGKKQSLLKNKFYRDGYVFQGWAVTADGEVVYKDEEAITVESDKTLYAVWANPPMTLTAESANWSNGSITLKCEDSDTSGAEHSYSLMYYEDIESEKKWYGIDGAQLVKANVEVTADGNSVLVTHLTDTRFAKRMDGLHTVKYRVVDENGRIAECVTRNRHGLFVAVDEYENGWLDAHANHTHQVSVFRGAYIRYGGADGYVPNTLSGSATKRETIFKQLKYIAENVATPGDIVLFYYVGHGTSGLLSCYSYKTTISASELYESFNRFPVGTGVVALIDSCHSASMIDRSGIDGDGMGNIAWIVAAQANETTYCGAFKALICDRGWLNGEADIYGINVFADQNGYVTFGELAAWGQQIMGDRNNYKDGNEYPFSPEDYGHMISYYNSLALDNMVAGKIPPQDKTNRIWTWLSSFPSLFEASAREGTENVSALPAANGCRTVGECYALGINPEDPNDDLKISHFEIKDGKPVITLNHTEDGSGNSFLPRVKTLGKSNLSDTEWREVPEDGDPTMRFFKVSVELP
jgi:uncharacterized repeat protein (TIGR02543 family)